MEFYVARTTLSSLMPTGTGLILFSSLTWDPIGSGNCPNPDFAGLPQNTSNSFELHLIYY